MERKKPQVSSSPALRVWLEAPDGTIERMSRDNRAPYDEQE